MSKDRARRRDEREQAAAVRRVAAQRRRARADRRRSRRKAIAPIAPRLRHRTRWRRQEGILARRRRMQNGVILCLIAASQLIVWLLTADWWLRFTAAGLAVIATPVLVTLALDRRP
jgi:Flp pilus assembly protein TadB